MIIVSDYPMSVVNILNDEGYAVPKIVPVEVKDRIDGINYAISLLPNRLGFIIKQCIGNKRTYDSVGRELNITRQRTQQLLQKALRELMRSERAIYLYYGLNGAREIINKTSSIPILKEADVVLPEPDYISKLRLSKRAYNALMRNGIRTIGQLLMLSDEDLVGLQTLGEKTLDEITNLSSCDIKQYADTYRSHAALFKKIDRSNDFTEEEKELIKGAFSDLERLQSKAAN